MATTAQDIEIIQISTSSVTEEHCYTSPVTPGQQRLLKAGTVQINGHRPLTADIILDDDIPIVVRDGITIFADIYRPSSTASSDAAKIPAILVGGPFGKNGGSNKNNFNKWPWRFGCPRIATSGLEKFEGPDPDYWCYHGYAVVHTDCRGTWKSGGDVIVPSKKEGEDNYDIIEFIAQQDWCNGKVTMAGNSYLAMTQWFAGAERPPHLACLAPWEGISDIYNNNIRRGGVPNPGFMQGMLKGDIASFTGGRAFDVHAMCYRYPVWNSFWESLRAKVENIQCPLYTVASWTNFLHTTGTFRGWEESGSSEKWLRVHNTHEWPDLYDPYYVEDLRRFYDYYMKGIQNDWPMTPRVRMSVLNLGGKDIVNRPETSFPLEREVPFKLYLHPDTRTLSETQPSAQTEVSYDAVTGDVVFSWPIQETVEFTGYISLRLWASTKGSNDMDIFARLRKINATTRKTLESVLVDVGRLAPHPEKERQELLSKHATNPGFGAAFFNSGPIGCLRASHRALDLEKSTSLRPVYTHKEEQLLQDGEVVPLDIAIWPYGMICNSGEELQLIISGYHPEPHCRPNDPLPELRNKGVHTILAGGEYDSYLLLPLIPSKKA